MQETKIIEVIKVYNLLRLKYERDKDLGNLTQLKKNLIDELDSILDETDSERVSLFRSKE